MTTFFTSDLHFGHARILELCPNRKSLGTTIEEHNESLIDLFNSRVSKTDRCYVLGDFALGQWSLAAGYFKRLNGEVRLIRGNHDRSEAKMLALGFAAVAREGFIEVDGLKLFLHHEPIMDLRRWYDGTDYHLCGHVHQDWARQGQIINVGVDVQSYRPKTIQELLQTPETLNPRQPHARSRGM